MLHWLEVAAGAAELTRRSKLVAPYADRPVFICGPGPFCRAAWDALAALKVPAQQVHIEVFKSLESGSFAGRQGRRQR